MPWMEEVLWEQGSVVIGKGKFSPSDVLEHTHRAETQPILQARPPSRCKCRAEGRIHTPEFAIRGLPLSAHHPAPPRAFLWLPGATGGSTAGGQLTQDLKYRLLMVSQEIPLQGWRDIIAQLQRLNIDSLNVRCACNASSGISSFITLLETTKKKKKEMEKT